MNRLLNIHNINFTCHHLHIDKSHTATKKILKQSQVHMKDKWFLMKDIKRIYFTNLSLEPELLLNRLNSSQKQGLPLPLFQLI